MMSASPVPTTNSAKPKVFFTIATKEKYPYFPAILDLTPTDAEVEVDGVSATPLQHVITIARDSLGLKGSPADVVPHLVSAVNTGVRQLLDDAITKSAPVVRMMDDIHGLLGTFADEGVIKRLAAEPAPAKKNKSEPNSYAECLESSVNKLAHAGVLRDVRGGDTLLHQAKISNTYAGPLRYLAHYCKNVLRGLIAAEVLDDINTVFEDKRAKMKSLREGKPVASEKPAAAKRSGGTKRPAVVLDDLEPATSGSEDEEGEAEEDEGGAADAETDYESGAEARPAQRRRVDTSAPPTPEHPARVVVSIAKPKKH
jgi:hypothetical protein